MEKIYAMLCVVVTNNRVLLLKRSPSKKYFPSKWAMVGATPLNQDDNMRAIALREIRDELGVKGEIIKEGKEIVKSMKEDKKLKEWHVFPFLARIDTKNVVLNEEHTQFVWVKPEEIDNYGVPEELKLVFQKILAQFKRE